MQSSMTWILNSYLKISDPHSLGIGRSSHDRRILTWPASVLILNCNCLLCDCWSQPLNRAWWSYSRMCHQYCDILCFNALCPRRCCQVKASPAAMQGASHCGMWRGMWGTLRPSLCSGLWGMPPHRRRDYRFRNYIKWLNSSSLCFRGTITQIQTIPQYEVKAQLKDLYPTILI